MAKAHTRVLAQRFGSGQEFTVMAGVLYRHYRILHAVPRTFSVAESNLAAACKIRRRSRHLGLFYGLTASTELCQFASGSAPMSIKTSWLAQNPINQGNALSIKP